MEVQTRDAETARTHRWPIPDTPDEVPDEEVPAVHVRELVGLEKVKLDRLQKDYQRLESEAREELSDSQIAQARETIESAQEDGDLDEDIDPDQMAQRLMVQAVETVDLYRRYVDFCTTIIAGLENIEPPGGGGTIDWHDDEQMTEIFGGLEQGRRQIVMSLGHTAQMRKVAPFNLATFAGNASTLTDDEAENFGS